MFGEPLLGPLPISNGLVTPDRPTLVIPDRPSMREQQSSTGFEVSTSVLCHVIDPLPVWPSTPGTPITQMERDELHPLPDSDDDLDNGNNDKSKGMLPGRVTRHPSRRSPPPAPKKVGSIKRMHGCINRTKSHTCVPYLLHPRALLPDKRPSGSDDTPPLKEGAAPTTPLHGKRLNDEIVSTIDSIHAIKSKQGACRVSTSAAEVLGSLFITACDRCQATEDNVTPILADTGSSRSVVSLAYLEKLKKLQKTHPKQVRFAIQPREDRMRLLGASGTDLEYLYDVRIWIRLVKRIEENADGTTTCTFWDQALGLIF